jgi:integrase
LKTFARGALVLPNAWERIDAYLKAREERFGPEPGNALLFQVIGPEGPEWIVPDGTGDPVPLAMTMNYYNQWVKRVWFPARAAAAEAPDTPSGLARMAFYDLRHTAISMALHSTLVVGPHGMNLHPLAGWSGHDIETLQRYYSHIIARYMGKPPIDLIAECRAAREQVATDA